MLGDKAYDSAELREELDERGTKPVIPNRGNRKKPFRFSKRLYKLRWRIESAFNRLKDFRRIATRYDIRQSLIISLSATIASTVLGVPIGAFLANAKFPGRGVLLAICNTGFGLPPVVVGLILSILLLRHGPLGYLNLRFTPGAMIIGQFILSLPIIINLTVVALQQLNPKLRLQIKSLGASRWQTLWLLGREIRLPLLVAYMAGFGAVVSEVGASQMLGGNLPGSTRVLTTAIVMET